MIKHTRGVIEVGLYHCDNTVSQVTAMLWEQSFWLLVLQGLVNPVSCPFRRLRRLSDSLGR